VGRTSQCTISPGTNRCLTHRQRLLKVTLLPGGDGEAIMSGCAMGIDSDRLLQPGPALVEASQLHQCLTKGCVEGGVTWPEPSCFAQLYDRILRKIQVIQCQTQARVGRDTRRSRDEGGREIADRLHRLDEPKGAVGPGGKSQPHVDPEVPGKSTPT